MQMFGLNILRGKINFQFIDIKRSYRCRGSVARIQIQKIIIIIKGI